jgi:hypothetical protein
VKEEILSRFGELGIRVRDGAVTFLPALLRRSEFSAAQTTFRYLDVDGRWRELTVPEAGLAFSWCQVPVVYRLVENGDCALTVTLDDGTERRFDRPFLPATDSGELFRRTGRIRRLDVALEPVALFPEKTEA